VPTPLKLIRWVPALSVIVTMPDRAPVPCGRNVTVFVQLAPGASALPQLLLTIAMQPPEQLGTVDGYGRTTTTEEHDNSRSG
jgi:hypothetical protein